MSGGGETKLCVEASGAGRDDRELLAVVLAELKQIAGDRPLPIVTLTDRPVSTAHPARPWRAAQIAIRREIAAGGPSDALRGEIAHEYAHVRRPDTWRHFALLLLALELGAVGLVVWLTGVIAPWLDHSHSLLWLGFWFAGTMLICAAVACNAWASRHRELRADALAAELLGDNRPILAMLEGCQARHERLGRWARVSSQLTHPSPARRRQALLNASPRAEDHRLAGGAVDLIGTRLGVVDRGGHGRSWATELVREQPGRRVGAGVLVVSLAVAGAHDRGRGSRRVWR